MEPTVSKPGEGEVFARDNRTLTVRVDLPGMSMLEIDFDESFAVDPHTHPDHVDAFYVLEGEVEFTAGDDTVRLGPGSIIAAPPGARHGFRNTGGGRARVLNIHAPDAGFVQGIRDYRPDDDQERSDGG